MTEHKNLKLPIQTHELLRRRAKALGMKQFVLADALIVVGLQMNDRQIAAAVVNAQLKPQSVDTSVGDPERKQ